MKKSTDIKSKMGTRMIEAAWYLQPILKELYLSSSDLELSEVFGIFQIIQDLHDSRG